MPTVLPFSPRFFRERSMWSLSWMRTWRSVGWSRMKGNLSSCSVGGRLRYVLIRHVSMKSVNFLDLEGKGAHTGRGSPEAGGGHRPERGILCPKAISVSLGSSPHPKPGPAPSPLWCRPSLGAGVKAGGPGPGTYHFLDLSLGGGFRGMRKRARMGCMSHRAGTWGGHTVSPSRSSAQSPKQSLPPQPP